MTGAILTQSDEVGDCRKLCEEMRRVLSRPRSDVDFLLSTDVIAMPWVKDRVVGLQTSKGFLEADLYVVCSGLQSRELLRPLGVNLPLYPVKGYSISPDILDRDAAPAASITDYDRRLVYAQINSTLRVAGFADVPGASRYDGARIASLVRQVEDLFPRTCALDRVRPWTDSRPTTPTGMPIIGQAGPSNVLVNVGQGALGFTLAAGSGRLISNLVAGRRRSDLASLDASKFALGA